jgi:acyl-coenzyme A synthetase/AMP-(fatty) acid ligase
MEKFENIAERILRVGVEDGERVAIVLPRGKITFARLRDMIVGFAHHARKHGIGRDSLVAIDIDNFATRPAVALACALLGAPWVDATPAVVRQKKLAYTHLLFGSAKAYEPSTTVIRVDESWASGPTTRSSDFVSAGPDDIWTYTQSSGTTGTPKFTAVRHRTVDPAAPAPGVRDFVLREGELPVFAFLAPASARGSASGWARIMANPGTVVLGADIALILRSGVNRVAGSPVQFARLLEGQEKPGARIGAAILGGAAASESLFARMLEFFERVQFMYGTTEVGLISARVVDSAPVDPSNVGKIFPSVEVTIVDENDHVLPAGREGTLRVRRADRSLAGYAGSGEATAALFRDGWFYPGDIARISETGELHLVGRSDDRLNLGGVKVDAGRVDNVVQNIAGVRDGYCFEDRDESGASSLALLLDLEDDLDAGTIVDEIHASMNASGLYYRIRRVYLTDDAPRTMSGKPVRRLAREFVREQKLINVVLRQPKSL